MGEKSEKEENKFECKVCEMTFPTRQDYERHMKKHHESG